MSRKNKKENYAVLFGFNLKDKTKTGYLQITPSGGYSIVKDASQASEFSTSVKAGKGSPLDWCEFFKTEPNISDWRFHPVILTR